MGAANCEVARVEEAMEMSEAGRLARDKTLQPEYDLYDRRPDESELEPVVRAHGLGVINYYSLASGFLSGKYRDAADASKSARGRGVVDKYLNPRGLQILDALDAISDAHQVTPTQVALAWQIARPGITAPIVSATSLKQLDDLTGATQLTLTPEQIDQLDQASR